VNGHTVFLKKTDRLVLLPVPVFCILLFAGTWPGGMNYPPDAERFLAVYFKGPFLFDLTLWMTWTLVLKHNRFIPFKEYHFLNSLPLPPEAMVCRFLFENVKSCLWIPILSLVPLLELRSVSPLSHLCRLGFLSGSAFVFSMLFNARLQLATLSRKRPHKPVRGIVLLTIAVYAASHSAFILLPKWASGLGFGISAVFLTALSFWLIFDIRRIFMRIQNSTPCVLHQRVGLAGWSPPQKKNAFSGSVFHPLWLKQIVQWKRMKSRSSMTGVVFLIAASYLAGANNAYPRDRAAVMLVLDLLYIVVFAVDGMQRFSAAEESSQILYSLPLSRRAFFVSAFLPVWFWMVAVFFTEVLLASSTAAFAAAAFVCGNYPDIRSAQQRFLTWIFGLFLALCMAYPLRFVTAAVFVFMPARSLMKTALYRIR
jgi:hypothetical protein